MKAKSLRNSRTILVMNRTLGERSHQLGLDKLISFTKKVEDRNSKIFGDVFESLLAAIYVEGGLWLNAECSKCTCKMEVANQFLHKFHIDLTKDVEDVDNKVVIEN